MKLYSYTIEERNGEHEYNHDLLVKAKSEKEAMEYAKSVAKNWYGSEPTIEDDGMTYDFFDVIVKITEFHKTTEKRWKQERFQRALL